MFSAFKSKRLGFLFFLGALSLSAPGWANSNPNSCFLSLASLLKILNGENKFQQTRFDLLEGDTTRNEVVNFGTHVKRKMAHLLGVSPNNLGLDDELPNNVTIQHLSLDKNGLPTFTVSGEKEVFIYAEDEVQTVNVRFIAKLRPDANGNLKQVYNKTSFQLWDTAKAKWGKQQVANPLELDEKPLIFSDFEIDVNSQLHQLPYRWDNNFGYENLMVRNIEIGKGSNPTILTLSAEQEVYDSNRMNPFNKALGTLRLIANFKRGENGKLERIPSTTWFQFRASGYETWNHPVSYLQ